MCLAILGCSTRIPPNKVIKKNVPTCKALLAMKIQLILYGIQVRKHGLKTCMFVLLSQNLDISEEHTEKVETSLENDTHEILIDNFSTMSNSFGEDIVGNNDMHKDNPLHEDVGCGGEMTPEAKEYIQNLQSRLNSVDKVLSVVSKQDCLCAVVCLNHC